MKNIFTPSSTCWGAGPPHQYGASTNRPGLARFLLAKSWHGSCLSCTACMGGMQINHYSLGAIFWYDIHSFIERRTRHGHTREGEVGTNLA